MTTPIPSPAPPVAAPATRGAYDELLDDLIAETASLRRLLAGLDASVTAGTGWDAPTPSEGWSVRDQIGHLAYFDEAAVMAVTDPERFEAEAAELVTRRADFADAVADEARRRPADELLGWWDRARAALVTAYRGADPRRRLPWYGPPMSVMSAATARLMETWAHGVDVADALGAPLEDSPRLRHVAHLGFRTIGFSFSHHGLAVPTTPVRVELTAAGGYRWVFGPDDATDVVRGPALDFCTVVAQRRHADDTRLEIVGPVAREWMATAQIFAGPATLPPPAGTRTGRATAGGADVERNLIQRVNVGDLLTRSARRTPGAAAIVDGDRRLTYAQLDAWVNGVANGLGRRGYRRGDRLALVAANCAEFLVVYFACAKLGVVCVPVNLGWNEREVVHVLGHSGARGVVTQAALLPGLAAPIAASAGVTHVVTIGAAPSGALDGPGRRVETLDELGSDGPGTGAPIDPPAVYVDERDPVTFLYTSGTTSAPKGVVGSHLAVYLESLSVALECRFDGTDRFVAVLPMFHTGQLNAHCTPAIAVGAAIHIMAAFDAGRLLELVEGERITQIFCLPMMYRALLEHPDLAGRDLTSLRRAAYAMAPMPEADLRRAIASFGCDFYSLFGQTEMSPSTTILRPEHQLSHTGAVGTPVVNVEVAVMGPDGTVLPPSDQGEIVYRGPQTMSGYHDDPAATAAAFAGGWFHSGDSGHFDDDGILWFGDRFKDVIKTGGENVASLEVERAILSHVPGVAEAAVVGLRHEHWSEAVTAFVVVEPGASVDADGLRRALHGHLDGYKMPKAVVTVAALPRTSTGKVRKTELRASHQDLYGGDR